MIFEITRDYTIIVPLMISNLIAYFISYKLQRQPIYEALAYQEGVHLPTAHSRSQADHVQVLQAMRSAPAVISPDLRIAAERIPVIISGMASSSVGWRELPYAKVPVGLDGASRTRWLRLLCTAGDRSRWHLLLGYWRAAVVPAWRLAAQLVVPVNSWILAQISSGQLTEKRPGSLADRWGDFSGLLRSPFLVTG